MQLMNVAQAGERRHLTFVLVLSLAFFIGSSLLAFDAPRKFSSPDETAAYLTALQFAATGKLSLESPASGVSSLVVPRSFSVRDGALVTGSFFGISLLYGSVARLLGSWVILYLTPLISGATIILFFLLVRKVFSSLIGLLSALLLALHPAFWYWSARGMFHNALFLDALIASILLLTHLTKRRSTGLPPGVNRQSFESLKYFSRYVGFGVFLGVALAVRSSEVVWVVPVVALITFALRRRIDFKLGYMVSMVSLLLTLLPIFHFNHELYGHPLSFGYEQGSLSSLTSAQSASDVVSKIRGIIAPFGVNLDRIGYNMWSYLVTVVWLPTVLSLIGVTVFLRWSKTSGQRWCFWITVLASLWLTVTYGSAEVNDRPDLLSGAIGTSYTRYWLPVYVALLPFAAIGLNYLSGLVSRTRFISGDQQYATSRWAVVVAGLISISILATSYRTVVADPEEGLVAISRNTAQFRYFADTAARVTPTDSIIVAGRGDKVFFPERSVIGGNSRAFDTSGLSRLIGRYHLYLYISAVDSLRRAEEEWNEAGFRLSDAIELSPYDKLYKIERQT